MVKMQNSPIVCERVRKIRLSRLLLQADIAAGDTTATSPHHTFLPDAKRLHLVVQNIYIVVWRGLADVNWLACNVL